MNFTLFEFNFNSSFPLYDLQWSICTARLLNFVVIFCQNNFCRNFSFNHRSSYAIQNQSKQIFLLARNNICLITLFSADVANFPTANSICFSDFPVRFGGRLRFSTTRMSQLMKANPLRSPHVHSRRAPLRCALNCVIAIFQLTP